MSTRYYNPEVERFLNADAFATTGQGLLGNNMFAYCANNPVLFIDPSGLYVVPDDPLRGPVWAHIGGNSSGIASTGASGGGGGAPLPFAGFTFQELVDVIDTLFDVFDLFNGFGNLSHASEYGIKGYSSLKAELSGTDLQAHHIIEQRFLNGLGIDVSTALSVAVTKDEHQVFTNAWREIFAYGKTPYAELEREQIWEAAQEIYNDYPELLSAAKKTLF